MTINESRVTYLGSGALGPLTTAELRIVRDVLKNHLNVKDMDKSELSVIDTLDSYIASCIEEATTVGKV